MNEFRIIRLAMFKGLYSFMNLKAGLFPYSLNIPSANMMKEEMDNKVFAVWNFKGVSVNSKPIEENSKKQV
ncbi:hypothetical protein NVV94_16760 [Pseudomonas sp. LS1212]|uniref:hypothetical protein n=1 Tax=Pseudomonas sp. LS1212 TaxID=2972478 RepID=UPI00215C9E7B|nr:hypothetical protein [Pseudomonas sp. LS1212]UVJ42290.1 hypothetical protein NVV94_16760 [Pseudomonas sp. LS1212]